MLILALEFSTDRRGVALLSGEPGGEARVLGEALEVGGRSTRSLHLVEEVLRSGVRGRREVERIAVGVGPGSYTGIRAAISFAQGWELALGVGAVGVSSVEAVARRAWAGGRKGTFSVVVDAHRNEFYVATYEADGGLRRMSELALETRNQVDARAGAGEVLIGMELPGVVEGDRVVWPEAATVGRIGLGMEAGAGSDRLEPVYLRETRFLKAPLPRSWGDSRIPGS